MKPHLVIVGAGLGGCILADSLAEDWTITMIDIGSISPLLQDRVLDLGAPALTYPHICSGPGGTTQLWHNGLIEIDPRIFDDRWPFAKAELTRYYDRAFSKLCGTAKKTVLRDAEILRKKYIKIGFPDECFRESLYYPKKRMNPWRAFKLKRRVVLIEAEVTRIEGDADGVIQQLWIRKKGAWEDEAITADFFVSAAGGLGTPILLDKTRLGGERLAGGHSGCHYEDHPSVFVGELTLQEPLYKLWNFPSGRGNLRLPLMLWQDGLQVSFQLKPVLPAWAVPPRRRVKSVISDLRNHPFDPRSYWRLLMHVDDVMEVMSFLLNWNVRTVNYSIFMVAEQRGTEKRGVWQESNSTDIKRNWIISQSDQMSYRVAIERMLGLLKDKVVSVKIYPDWINNVYSGSHHSGTARMAPSDDKGVCDPHGRVFGTKNLYVCDGSIIPGTGIANTGLTIAALGLRLAEHLRMSERQREGDRL